MFTFNENELKPIREYSIPAIYSTSEMTVPEFDRPITAKENMLRMLSKDQMPLWVPNQDQDNNAIMPMVFADNHARAAGGVDSFGIDWTFDPLTNAAMVTPGFTRLDDINDWRELTFPDLDAIDWQADFEQNYKDKISPDKLTYFVIVNGMFERTADLIGFEDAFCALLTDDDVLDEFWTELDEWHMKLIDIARDVYGADMIANNGNPQDDHGHGTHVAGIVAASNNKEGVVGVAFNTRIMAVKAGQASGYFNQSDIA